MSPSKKASSSVIEKSDGIRHFAEPELFGDNYIWLTMEGVLDAIGMKWRQIVLMLVMALLYGHFSMQFMTASLITPSLWKKWPELEQSTVVFNTIHAVGAFCRLAGSIVLVPLSDRIGRYTILAIALGGSATAALLSAVANSFPLLVVLRSCALFFASSIPSLCTVYTVETIQCRKRAIPSLINQSFGALYVAYAIGMKMLMEAGLDDTDDSKGTINAGNIWRWAQGIFQLPTIIVVIWFALFHYDTPRFLLSVKENRERAWKVLSKLTGGGELSLRQKLNLPEAEFPSLPDSVRFTSIDDIPVDQRVVRGGFRNYVTTTVKHVRYVCRSPDHRMACYALMGIWGLQSFVHWGVNSYCVVFYNTLGLNGNLTTLFSYVLQVPTQVIVYWLMSMPSGGRILSMKIGALVSGLLSVLLAILWVAGTRNIWLLTCISVASNITGAPLWGPIYSYSAERFPTIFRGSVMGLFSVVNSTATIITTYVGSISMGSNLWVLPLVWGLVRLMISPLCFLLDREVNLQSLVDREGDDP